MCGYQQWCNWQQPLRRTLQLKGATQQPLNSSTPAGNKKLLL
jgi:hypothetical protein